MLSRLRARWEAFKKTRVFHWLTIALLILAACIQIHRMVTAAKQLFHSLH